GVWAQRMPRDDRDLVEYFIPIEVGSKRVGTAQRSSRYAFGGEVFNWKRDGAKVVLELPQRQKSITAGARTWACADAPKGFDLCLELSVGSEKVRYYSRKGWRVPKGDEALPTAVVDPGEIEACADCAPAGLEALR
ncbi:MAG: hypothetical protein ABMB14_37390, partial [Myxococcota bacterium]